MSDIFKKASTSKIESVKVVSNEHLNANNTLFGGYLMCWVDEIAFMCACRFTNRKTCVTVGIDNVSFKSSQKLGEHVHLQAQVVNVGHTSIEIVVHVYAEDMTFDKKALTNQASLTFVSLDEQNKPLRAPRLILDTPESQHSFRESELRMRVKKRLSAYIAKNITRDVIKETVPQQAPKYVWPKSFHWPKSFKIVSSLHGQIVAIIENRGLRLPTAPRIF